MHGGRTRYTVSIANDGFNDARHVPVLIKIPRYQYELDRHNYIEPLASWLPPGGDPSQIVLHFDTDDGNRVLFLMIPILQSHSSVEVAFIYSFRSAQARALTSRSPRCRRLLKFCSPVTGQTMELTGALTAQRFQAKMPAGWNLPARSPFLSSRNLSAIMSKPVTA